MDISVRRHGRFNEIVIQDGNCTIECGLLDVYDCEVEAAKLREAADDLYIPPEISQERELREAVLEFLLTYVPLDAGAGEEEFFSHYEDIKGFVEKIVGIVE